ncbi:hypothetical protein ACLOJK_036587, partial [Asimina triloba]
ACRLDDCRWGLTELEYCKLISNKYRELHKVDAEEAKDLISSKLDHKQSRDHKLQREYRLQMFKRHRQLRMCVDSIEG